MPSCRNASAGHRRRFRRHPAAACAEGRSARPAPGPPGARFNDPPSLSSPGQRGAWRHAPRPSSCAINRCSLWPFSRCRPGCSRLQHLAAGWRRSSAPRRLVQHQHHAWPQRDECACTACSWRWRTENPCGQRQRSGSGHRPGRSPAQRSLPHGRTARPAQGLAHAPAGLRPLISTCQAGRQRGERSWNTTCTPCSAIRWLAGVLRAARLPPALPRHGQLDSGAKQTKIASASVDLLTPLRPACGPPGNGCSITPVQPRTRLPEPARIPGKGVG